MCSSTKTCHACNWASKGPMGCAFEGGSLQLQLSQHCGSATAAASALAAVEHWLDTVGRMHGCQLAPAFLQEPNTRATCISQEPYTTRSFASADPTGTVHVHLVVLSLAWLKTDMMSLISLMSHQTTACAPEGSKGCRSPRKHASSQGMRLQLLLQLVAAPNTEGLTACLA